MDIYLDNSATTKPYKEVVQAMTDCMMNFYGNPSSIHSFGEKAKKYLKECKRVIADTLKAEEDEIVFTSGGSESNNFLLKGFLKAGDHLITTCIEHSSILNSCVKLEKNGVEVTYLKVDNSGRIDLQELKNNIKANTGLVSIMHVNNEIGVIQDIEAIGTIIKEAHSNIMFHVDAVQSYGKLAIDVGKLNIDLLSISGHKLHGPRGIGAAYIRRGLIPKALIDGGGQEYGLRSGTENLPAIAGFAEAAKTMQESLDKNFALVKKLRDYLCARLRAIEDIRINTCIEYSLPHVLNISAVGIRSGKILFYLDARHIYLSKSSACFARKLTDSHVLKAIGLNPEEILGSLRVSFSEDNTLEEIDLLVEHIEECLQELKSKKD
jgi:cysteine desulfurase